MKAQEILIWVLFRLEERKAMAVGDDVHKSVPICGVEIEEENYWQKTFVDVDFPLNKFQNDVLKDRISILVLSIGVLRDSLPSNPSPWRC